MVSITDAIEPSTENENILNSAYDVLSHLFVDVGRYFNPLSDRSGISPEYLSPLLGFLEDAGYVDLHKSAGRNQNIYRSTEKGVDYKEAFELVSDENDKLDLTPADVITLFDLDGLYRIYDDDYFSDDPENDVYYETHKGYLIPDDQYKKSKQRLMEHEYIDYSGTSFISKGASFMAFGKPILDFCEAYVPIPIHKQEFRILRVNDFRILRVNDDYDHELMDALGHRIEELFDGKINYAGLIDEVEDIDHLGIYNLDIIPPNVMRTIIEPKLVEGYGKQLLVVIPNPFGRDHNKQPIINPDYRSSNHEFSNTAFLSTHFRYINPNLFFSAQNRHDFLNYGSILAAHSLGHSLFGLDDDENDSCLMQQCYKTFVVKKIDNVEPNFCERHREMIDERVLEILHHEHETS